MWRAAASLELLPLGTKTELGDALVKRVKAGDFKESELWCLSRLGARKLFYGPINQVVPPATVSRWVEALLRLPAAGDALAAMARRTEDPTRDLPAATRDAVRSKLQTLPHADRLLAVLDGEEEDDRTLGRIFGEELPSGLVLARGHNAGLAGGAAETCSRSGRFTTLPARIACAPIGLMGEMQAFGWLAGCCLLVHCGSAPGYSQTENTPAAQRVALGASPFRVRVVGTTNTQAVLTYSAPDDSACTVKVSQQASFTPLVRDVDPALFPGADQDTRPETVTAKSNRIFVVGKRITQRASDGKNYSRALETYATHYYQVACGSAVATGSFTTSNIPLGMTYNDVPQVDESNPGQWMIPTQLQDRTQTIVDPQTGALLKRVSLDAEAGNKSYGYAGAFLTYGGFNRVCSASLTGPSQSKRGYLCVFPDYDLQLGLLYFIVPTTGEVLYLGLVPYAGASVNGSDLSIYYSYRGQILSDNLYR